MKHISAKNAFKIAIASFLFISCSALVQAQPVLPSPIGSSMKINYIRTWEANAPEQNPNALINRSITDVKQTTQYLDGLGRPLQTVVKQGSTEFL
jgi:hypothetical protein